MKELPKTKQKHFPQQNCFFQKLKEFNDDGTLHYTSRYCAFPWKPLLLLEEEETARGLNKMAEWHQAGKGTALGNRWEIVGSVFSLHSRVFQVTFQGYYSQAESMSDTAVCPGRH